MNLHRLLCPRCRVLPPPLKRSLMLSRQRLTFVTTVGLVQRQNGLSHVSPTGMRERYLGTGRRTVSSRSTPSTSGDGLTHGTSGTTPK